MCFFLFTSFVEPSKSSDLKGIKTKTSENISKQLNSSKKFNIKASSNSSKEDFDVINKYSGHKKSAKQFIAKNNENQQELIIESNKQSEINNIIYAEGKVSVYYKGKLLKADNLIYDKLNKKISAKGNITLILGDQIFELSQLEYSFLNDKGYLLEVRGSININTLMDDLSSNFSLSDADKIQSLFSSQEVLNTPDEVKNWLFFTEKMTIDGKKWKSEKAFISNDLLELKQVKLAINSLEVIPDGKELRFSSALNYLILEEKVSIPFWLGERTINFNESQLNNRWNIGYENLDKDGYFIGRKFNSIDISDNFVLNLEPQFLIYLKKRT